VSFQNELWTDLDYEDQNIIDDKKCFRLSQDCGQLLPVSIPIHYIPSTLALYNKDDNYAQFHKPHKLDFVFKPETNALYKCKFVIRVEWGPAYEITLKGRGAFEEEVEIK
jgi:hypothetical protein